MGVTNKKAQVDRANKIADDEKLAKTLRDEIVLQPHGRA
jgi:hypothetical protein